jgi:hypothetical protein
VGTVLNAGGSAIQRISSNIDPKQVSNLVPIL